MKLQLPARTRTVSLTTALSSALACIFGLVFLVAAPSLSFARGNGMPMADGMANETPAELKDVGVVEHLGSAVDFDLKFRDEDGHDVKLGDYARDGKPVLLSLAYYNCPSLCSFHINGMLAAFKQMKQTLGSEFHYVIVSIEPKETPDLAAKKKANYIKAYGRPEGAAGWHFLTGEEASIHKLAEQVGFQFRWDPVEKQWAHVSAAYVLTSSGKISRYLYGINFEPKTVRLSMIEASEGKVGSPVDKLLLFCFHFDPKVSKYSLAAFNVMRGGAVMIVLVIAAFMIPFWIRGRKTRQGEA